MTPRSPTISNFCYYLPLYQAYFGTDVLGLRLALCSITNNPRRTVEILL